MSTNKSVTSQVPTDHPLSQVAAPQFQQQESGEPKSSGPGKKPKLGANKVPVGGWLAEFHDMGGRAQVASGRCPAFAHALLPSRDKLLRDLLASKVEGAVGEIKLYSRIRLVPKPIGKSHLVLDLPRFDEYISAL